MTQPTILAQRLRECCSGRWIANTNFTELLEDLTFEEATTSYEGANSIALLTYHLRYYLHGIQAVFDGGELTIRDAYSFDMPDLHGQEGWGTLRASFLQAMDTMCTTIESWQDEDLQGVFVKPAYGDYLRTVNGVIEHTYYHMGQMVLLSKLIRR